MTIRPVRLRLSRRAGFRLQDASREANGLACEVVTRPHSTFQNRWKIGTWSNHLGREVATGAEAVECFRLLSGWATDPHMIGYVRERLAGKNLACWCALPAPGEPDICHAAVLLEIANREQPEP